uniref:Uncharacterized protein At4g28440-like isoform X1 n=1 Tax=Elaeis guineensis var. tenera TaxID=51953 RepID=A0A6J0PHK0_ELAGV|nr:uncharacterized protein At4g28440-like isoform X1 [Elaeis guineensis]
MATVGQQQQGEGAAKPALRKPVFTKVDQLKPGTSGHTLTVKVVSSETVLQKGRAASAYLRQTRIAECVVGDETGTIVFTARNDQGTNVSPCLINRSFFYPGHCCERWRPAIFCVYWNSV